MKNILIFCSWLDLNSKISSFFSVQTVVLKPEYNPILVAFRNIPLGFRTMIFNKKNFEEIRKSKCHEGLLVIEVYYPSFWFFPTYMNKKLRLRALARLKSNLDKDCIDISFIHAQSLFNAGIWAYDYYINFSIPYIFTEHNQLSFRYASIKKGTLITKVIENAKKKLVVSNDKIRQFATNGFYSDFINVGNLIVDNFYFRGFEPKEGLLRLVTIGAYSPIKDQETIFKSLNLIDKYLGNVICEFTWIGCNGWGENTEQEAKEMIKKYTLRNIKVKLLPILDREEIAEIFSMSDLFIFSSISEGMPVSVLEAIACGLPVFTTNCGGVDELIDSENGQIFQIGDYKKLANLILSFQNNEFYYDREKNSKDILDRFGKAVFREKIINIYNSVGND